MEFNISKIRIRIEEKQTFFNSLVKGTVCNSVFLIKHLFAPNWNFRHEINQSLSKPFSPFNE